MTSHWYALHVHPNSEARVETELGRRGLEAYYPFREVPVRRAHAKERMVRRAFFPGYVFSRFDYEADAVLQIPWIVQILGFGKTPVAIPDQEIESLRLMVESPLNAEICPYFTEGDPVRVVKGPLKDVEGIVVYLRGKARVVVSVNMLQRSVSAEVPREWLEVLPAMKKAA